MTLSTNSLAIAKKIARKNLGLDVRSIGVSLIEHALSRRMDETELSEDDYFRHIVESAEEQRKFIQGLLVSESWFFREEEPVQFALSKLRASTPIRILSVPAAKGEELISTYIYCAERSIPFDEFSFEGFDLSESAVEQSRIALYSSYSFRSGYSERINRFFSKQGSAYSFREERQKFVKVNLGDILSEKWHPQWLQYDLILCRNFFIYLRPERQRSFLKRIHSLLKPTGLLVMGVAEAALLQDSGFTPLRSMPSVFSPQTVEPSQVHEAPLFRLPSKETPKAIRKFKEIAKNSLSPLPIEPAASHVPEILTMIEDGEYRDAFRLCLESIEAAPCNSKLYYLAGVVSVLEEQKAQAKFFLEKAITLDPENDEVKAYITLLKDQ